MKHHSRPVIRILIVDDQELARRGNISALAKEPEMKIVGQAVNGLEAIQMVNHLMPDIILMDIQMPHMGGLEATRQICAQYTSAKVLLLSYHNNQAFVLDAIRSGARGYLLKDVSAETLIKAIKQVYRGKKCFGPHVSPIYLDKDTLKKGKQKKSPTTMLTPRETLVLAMVASSCSSKEIAHHLGQTVRTVESTRQKIMKKLAIHDKVGLTRYAIAQGIISTDSLDL